MTISDRADPELALLLRGGEFEVTVGIHAEDGSKKHGSVTTADVGSFHEFGLGVPQRSFIRGYMDEEQAAINAQIDAALARVANGADPKAQAELLGVFLEGGIKERILARIPPELAESTKRKRGEDAVPLVDTGQLLGAIKSKVHER